MGIFSLFVLFNRSKKISGVKRKLGKKITEEDRQWVGIMIARIVNVEDTATVYFRMNSNEFVVTCDLASEYGRSPLCFGVLNDVGPKKWDALWRYIRDQVRVARAEKKEGEIGRSLCVYVDPETTRGDLCYVTKDREFYVNIFLHVTKPQLFKDDDSSCCGCYRC